MQMLPWVRLSSISLLLLQGVSSFHSSRTLSPISRVPVSRLIGTSVIRLPSTSCLRQSEEESWGDDEDDFEILFEEKKAPNLDAMEKAWRYAKKPLLSIGAKGATLKQGNSLRQLLDSHTVVKVKVNTNKFGTLEKAFEDIRTLAEESGAPEGIEMLQARDKDKVILFALPGTTGRLESGDFPPPPPPPKEAKEED